MKKSIAGLVCVVFAAMVLFFAWKSPAPKGVAAQETKPGTTGMAAPIPMFAGDPATFLTCNDASARLASYNTVTGQMSFCNGTNWVNIVTSTAFGSPVALTNLTGAMSTQTICDTGNACPAGFYSLDIYVNVTQVATLGSINNVTVSYTDDMGATTQNAANCTSISLLSQARLSCFANFYHAANTTVTVSTTVGSITGSPKYNFRAALVKEF